MSEIYTKLAQKIVYSSLWEEDGDTCKLWITLLGLKRYSDGVVDKNITGIARIAKLPMEKVEEAMRKFQEPDPMSSSQEFEGRRIKKVSEGWQVLNHEKYQEYGWSEEKKQMERERKARYRDKQKQAALNAKPVPESVPEPEEQESVNDQVDRVYEQYPKKAGKPKAVIAIRNAISKFGFEFVLQKTIEYAKARQGQNPQYTTFPQGWFNAHRFNDDPSTWKDTDSSQSSKPGLDPTDPKDIRNFL